MKKEWRLYLYDNGGGFDKRDMSYVFSASHYIGSDFFFHEIFDWKESPTGCIYEMWDCFIDADDIVLDLGANVGFFTYYAAQKAKRVISIEGGVEAFSCLVENTHDLENVEYLNASILGDRSKKPILYSYRNNPINVGIEDVFRMFDLEKINFLKCDIEGGEYDLLMNMDPEILSKIDKIAVETHDITKTENFYLPGKTRHTFYWDINQNGKYQVMCYFVPSY
jgi:hypothetical protein